MGHCAPPSSADSGTEAPGRLALRAELDERGRVLLLRDQEVAIRHECRALALRSLGVHPGVVEWMPLRDLESDPRDDLRRVPVEELDARRRLLEDQDPPGAIGAHGLDLRILARDLRPFDLGQVDGLPDVRALVVGRELDPRGDRRPIPERHHGHIATGLTPETDPGDLLQRHVLGAQHRKFPLVASLRHQPSVSPSLSAHSLPCGGSAPHHQKAGTMSRQTSPRRPPRGSPRMPG